MSLQSILNELKIETSDNHHHSRSGWIQIKHCPYCNSHNYHLGVRTKFLYANCYRCGRHQLSDALSKLSGLPRKQINDLLKNERSSIEPQEAQHDWVAPFTLIEPKGIGPLQSAHIRYLADRGFNPKKLAKLWNIGGLGIEAGRLAWRIYIPIEIDGRRVSWTTRSISPNAEKRYMACKSSECLIPRNQILYGLDYVRHCIILTEGPADVWAIGPSAVCSLGTSISAKQLNIISQYPIRVICMDSQPAAQKVALGLVKQLEVFQGETYNVQLDAKDAGEADRKEIRHLRKFFKIED